MVIDFVIRAVFTVRASRRKYAHYLERPFEAHSRVVGNNDVGRKLLMMLERVCQLQQFITPQYSQSNLR